MSASVQTRARIRAVVLWGVLGLGLLLAHRSHRVADEARFRHGASTDRVAPHAPSLRAASLGQPTLVADLMWVRTVLAFADIHDAPTPEGVEWVGAMVDTVCILDDEWRTAYFYGGSFMRVLGDIDHSDAIFEAGHKARPADPFFPFSLGMNAYLYRHDTKGALRWISTAADLPGAPSWYRSAVAGFIKEGGDRRAALHYLEEQLRSETRPRMREALDAKYKSLLHEELEDQVAAHRQKFRDTFGRDIQHVRELGTLPDDPLGGTWVLAPDGQVRSSVREAQLARGAVKDERGMILLPVGRRPF